MRRSLGVDKIGHMYADLWDWFSIVVLLAALGCGLVAGIFFAFSSFVMAALSRLPPAGGAAAMQSINVAVLNPVFLGVFLGTAVACGVVLVSAIVRWSIPGTFWLVVGSTLYIVGTFVVTIAFNVPRNNDLAAVEPASPEGATVWGGYVPGWTAWNHVRTAAALAAAAALTLGLVQMSKSDSLLRHIEWGA
jgi:uncharacterized membrane protein